MRTTLATRLKAFEDENAKLKRLLAEQQLDMAAMKKLPSRMLAPATMSEEVAHLAAFFGPTERRACQTAEGRLEDCPLPVAARS